MSAASNLAMSGKIKRLAGNEDEQKAQILQHIPTSVMQTRQPYIHIYKVVCADSSYVYVNMAGVCKLLAICNFYRHTYTHITKYLGRYMNLHFYGRQIYQCQDVDIQFSIYNI